jgi:hypothetical protein
MTASTHGSPSFDHLVSLGEKRWRHDEAERPRRPEIDNELEPSGLNDRQLRRRGASEDAADLSREKPIGILEIWSEADQPTLSGKIGPSIESSAGQAHACAR